MDDDPVPGRSSTRIAEVDPTMRLFEWLIVAFAIVGAAILAFLHA